MSEEPDLVLPFLPVASKGGPFDDASYMAGYEMGVVDATLRASNILRKTVTATIHTANTEQADLIAMRHGFVSHAEELDSWPGWSTIRFYPGPRP